jgi:hypothetical protein
MSFRFFIFTKLLSLTHTHTLLFNFPPLIFFFFQKVPNAREGIHTPIQTRAIGWIEVMIPSNTPTMNAFGTRV